MVLKIGKLRRAVSKMRQPFRFLAHLSLCGYISGVLCVLTGALLLAFFGSNLREDEAIKRIPTWIGIIATGSGIMFLFVGITLTILLCKLFDQHAAWEVSPPFPFFAGASTSLGCPFARVDTQYLCFGGVLQIFLAVLVRSLQKKWQHYSAISSKKRGVKTKENSDVRQC